MKDFLRLVQLITPLVFDFPISKDEFLQRLKPHVAPPHTNPFGRLGRIFSPTIAPYSGTIQPGFIRIKPRADGNWTYAPTFRAALLPEPSGVRVQGELNGVSLSVVALTLFYLAFVLFGLTSLVSQIGNISFLSIGTMLFSFLCSGIVFVGLPYFKARRGMQKMANDLERDLFYFVERPKSVVAG